MQFGVQMDIEEAIAAATAKAAAGMAQALEHAESDAPGWSERAFEFLKRYAAQNSEFPGFFVTAASELDKSFPAPANERAWGGIYRRAMLSGVIAKTGRTMPHPKRHGCPAAIYRSLVFGQ